jgi:hypothetical protein
MADGKETYPTIPEKSWWELRKKFKQSPPVSGVSTNYLSNLFSIGQKAAANIKPTLRRIGLINDDGTIKDRAYEWRDDAQYAKVCNEMRTELYPQELIDLYPNPTDEDKEPISRWFANKSKVGTAASKMMAAFYILLSKADPTAESEAKGKRKTEGVREKPKPEQKVTKSKTTDIKIQGNVEKELNIPSININIEVHISADADTTQIDKIFESMAKHLNIRRKTNNE